MKKTVLLFLFVILTVSLFSCVKKEPDSTKTCHVTVPSFSSVSCTEAEAPAPKDVIDSGHVQIIKNETWSASANCVSYSKIIFSEAEIRGEMKSVCVQTEKTQAIWAGFDEAFFEENALLYLTFNSAEIPAALSVSSVKKGQSVCVAVECEKSDTARDMASYTVLVTLAKSSVTGAEKAEILIR